MYYEKDMDKENLIKKLSELETINDQLIAEFNYLNELLKQLGFEKGLKTLKMAAQELLKENCKKEKEE